MTETKPSHRRRIEICSYDLGDHRVLVEGELEDTRPPLSGGEESAPRQVHHLVARLWVQGPDLTVVAVDARMRQVPREACPEALPAAQKLVGLRISRGFTRKVKERIGEVRGCSHLTNLFLTLGPVAVQGYWAAYGRKAGARNPENPAFSRVINSCHVWREDGPAVQSLRAALKEKGEKT